MTRPHFIRVPDDGIVAVEAPLVGLRDGVEEEGRQRDQAGDDHVGQGHFEREDGRHQQAGASSTTDRPELGILHTRR